MFAPVQAFFQEFWNQVKPPRPFSWQTLVLLSFFSWGVSWLISNSFLQNLLATIGWFFLTLGIGWGTAKLRFSLLGWKWSPGPWITGAAIVGLLFAWNILGLQVAIAAWPIATAGVMSIPRFLAPGPNIRIPKPGDRQVIVITVLMHSILSCWIGFYFTLQRWVQTYPSILVDNMERSAFVIPVAIGTTPEDVGERMAVTLLTRAGEVFYEEIGEASWPNTVRWLMNDRNEFANLRSEVLDTMPSSHPEQAFWDFGTTRPVNLSGTQEGYLLTFRAFWLGPSSHTDGYHVDRPCWVVEGREFRRIRQFDLAWIDEIDGFLGATDPETSAVVAACLPISGPKFSVPAPSSPPSSPSEDTEAAQAIAP